MGALRGRGGGAEGGGTGGRGRGPFVRGSAELRARAPLRGAASPDVRKTCVVVGRCAGREARGCLPCLGACYFPGSRQPAVRRGWVNGAAHLCSAVTAIAERLRSDGWVPSHLLKASVSVGILHGPFFLRLFGVFLVGFFLFVCFLKKPAAAVTLPKPARTAATATQSQRAESQLRLGACLWSALTAHSLP